MAHRKAIAGHREPHDNLGGVLAPVLAVASLSGGRVALVACLETALNLTLAIPLILFVDLEVQRGSVVEHDIYIKVEQIGYLERV